MKPYAIKSIKDANRKPLLSTDEVTKHCTEYCEQLFRKEPLDEEDFNKELENVFSSEDEADNPIPLSEAEATIKRLKARKSPGCEGIGAKLLQARGEPLARVLHGICKETWRQEWLPEELTKSAIVTLPKKGDLGLCSNYRTMSLINYACKVLLLILLKGLKGCVEFYL